MNNYIKIGNYVPRSESGQNIIEKEWSGQGYIFKDEEAFLNYEDKVCYIPELSDTEYTRKDIVEICDQQYELAKQCFYGLSWESPDSWVLDTIGSGIWGECKKCCRYFFIDDESDVVCPFCNNRD